MIRPLFQLQKPVRGHGRMMAFVVTEGDKVNSVGCSEERAKPYEMVCQRSGRSLKGSHCCRVRPFQDGAELVIVIVGCYPTVLNVSLSGTTDQNPALLNVFPSEIRSERGEFSSFLFEH